MHIHRIHSTDDLHTTRYATRQPLPDTCCGWIGRVDASADLDAGRTWRIIRCVALTVPRTATDGVQADRQKPSDSEDVTLPIGSEWRRWRAVSYD